MCIYRPILPSLQAQRRNNNTEIILAYHWTVRERAIMGFEVQIYNMEEAEKPVIIL